MSSVQRCLAPPAVRISTASRLGHWQEALRIFSGVPETKFTCSAVIAACTKASEWHTGLLLFQRFLTRRNQPETAVANAAIGAAAAGKNWVGALGLFEKIKNPDVTSHTVTMMLCARSSRWLEGLVLLARMEALLLNLDLPAKLAAMRLLGDSGSWEAALHVLRDYSSPHKIPVEAYNACIASCGKAHAVHVASELLTEMNNRSVKPTQLTFGAALQACALSAQPDWAMELLSQMKDHRLSPDAAAYAAAIGACGRAGDWRASKMLLSKAEAAGTAEITCWNATIAAFGRTGRWQDALDLFKSLGASRTTVSWNAAITACAEAGEWPVALGLLDTMSTSSGSSSAVPNTITFNAAINACANSSSWTVALGILQMMTRAGSKPNLSTMTASTTACEKGGASRLALNLWWGMRIAGGECASPTTPAYNAVLSAAARGAFWQESLDLLREMVTHCIPKNDRTWQAILRACERCGKYLEAARALIYFRHQLEPRYLEHVAARLELHITGLLSSNNGDKVAVIDAERGHVALVAAGSLPSLAQIPKADESKVDFAPLQAAVAHAIPGAIIQGLGSSVEGLRSEGSDADATVILPVAGVAGSHGPGNMESEERRRDIRHRTLRQLRPRLEGAVGLRVVGMVLQTRMPILKLLLPCGTPADLSVENHAGVQKSALIVAHLRTAPPALREVCFLLKAWARHRNIYGQLDGYPSGLGFACMVIFVGQCLKPPLTATIDPAQLQIASTCGVEAAPLAETEPELALRFLYTVFAFYADQFNWQEDLVSIRLGRIVRRQLPGTVLSIEDPVELQKDLAFPYMNAERSASLKSEFQKAKLLMEAGQWSELFGRFLPQMTSKQ